MKIVLVDGESATLSTMTATYFVVRAH